MAKGFLLGYTGAYQDPGTGSYPLGNGYRMYVPELLRFARPDDLSPFGEGGINPYVYCADDPVNHSDPSGHLNWFAWVNIGFSVIASASSLALPFLRFEAIEQDMAIGTAIAMDVVPTGSHEAGMAAAEAAERASAGSSSKLAASELEEPRTRAASGELGGPGPSSQTHQNDAGTSTTPILETEDSSLSAQGQQAEQFVNAATGRANEALRNFRTLRQAVTEWTNLKEAARLASTGLGSFPAAESRNALLERQLSLDRTIDDFWNVGYNNLKLADMYYGRALDYPEQLSQIDSDRLNHLRNRIADLGKAFNSHMDLLTP